MTKTELQVALAQATQTDKKTAGAFLDTLGTLAYKEVAVERGVTFFDTAQMYGPFTNEELVGGGRWESSFSVLNWFVLCKKCVLRLLKALPAFTHR